MRGPIGFLAGLVFGIGLLLGGMADPRKVLAFLDLAGAWDPSLALVMGGAIAVALPAFALARRRPRAWSGDAIALPTNRRIDARLAIGGLLFGVGWGLAGYCPGPALVALGSGSAGAALFVLAMGVGMSAHDAIVARRG
jgi:uncharacterized membrane protein YedE/YeeE